MAFTYPLALSSDASPATLLDSLQALLAQQGFHEIGWAEGRIYVPRMLFISAHTVEHSEVKAMYQELGLDAHSEVNFTLYKSADGIPPEALPLLAILATRLASDTGSEALLAFEADVAIFRRRQGLLELFDWWPTWQERAVLDQLADPYVLTSDPGRL